MEKLIHILPNLITNEDSTWLQKAIKNPDYLSQFIMRHNKSYVSTLSVMRRGRFREHMLGETINDNSTVDELITAIEETNPVGRGFAELLEDLKTRVNCEGKSATSLVWAASILNTLEDRNVSADILTAAFYSIANTRLGGEKKSVSALIEELRDLVSTDKKLAEATETSLSYSFVKNAEVQESDSWYDFNTFEEIELSEGVEIHSTNQLYAALKDLKNYSTVIDYVKKTYLSEDDPRKDGYCKNEDEKHYKALIIVSALASDRYQFDEEFDTNNTIGFNITADILELRDKIDHEHILDGISNKLNSLESAAGRIVAAILGREVEVLPDKRTVILPKGMVKVGSYEDYIKNNLNSFEKLIQPNMSYTLDLLNSIDRMQQKYQDKAYRGSEKVEETLAFIAGELDVDLIAKDSELAPKERLMQNLDMLYTAANDRYSELDRMMSIYKQVRSKQKTNLDIEDVEFNKSLLGKHGVIATAGHEGAIKEYYRILSADPILKVAKGKKQLRIKSPKMVLADIQQQVAESPDVYPQLARLFSHFKLSNQEKIQQIIESYYMNPDGTTNDEYKEIYIALRDKASEQGTKSKAVESADLLEEDKDKLNELI